MKKNMTQKETLVRDLEFFLKDLCRDWGFCNRLVIEDLLSPGGMLSAEQFAVEILRAEGMNSELESDWRQRVGKRIIDRFGPTIVA